MKLPTNQRELSGQLALLKNNPQVVLAVVVFFLLLDAAFLVRWQLGSIRRLSAQVGQLNTEIRNSNIDSKFTSTYKTRLSDLKNEVSDLSKMIIADENLPVLIESISKFGNLCGVRILEIKPTDTSVAEQKVVVGSTQEVFFRKKIFISARAGFHQLGRFVALLENHSVFLDIKNLEIHTDAQELLRQSVTMNVEVVLKKTPNL